MMRKSLPIFLLTLAASFTLVACKPQSTPSANTNINDAVPVAPEQNTAPAADAITPVAQDDAAAGQIITINVVAKQFEFVPSTIVVKQGQTVRLVIENTDVDHGFAIPELGVSQSLPAGQTTLVEFTADQVGTFSFSCNVFCGSGHREMRGTLV